MKSALVSGEILPSGNLLHSYGKWPIEIVDLPLKMVIFHSYVKLPEGNFPWFLPGFFLIKIRRIKFTNPNFPRFRPGFPCRRAWLWSAGRSSPVPSSPRPGPWDQRRSHGGP